MSRKVCLLSLVLLLLAMAYPVFAQAPSATFAWDAVTTNTDGTPITDLAGYRIYMSLNPMPDTSPRINRVADVAAGQLTAVAQIVAPIGAMTYFRATAYDTSGNEGGYSNQVSLRITDTLAPGMVRNFRCQSATVGAGVTLTGCSITIPQP